MSDIALPVLSAMHVDPSFTELPDSGVSDYNLMKTHAVHV